jgi:hypothetical protein
MRQLMRSPPPGAKAFFIGDENGGSGWVIPQPDGSDEKYYVELPPNIGITSMHLPNAPKFEGPDYPKADQLIEAYLAKVKELVRVARERFGAASKNGVTG